MNALWFFVIFMLENNSDDKDHSQFSPVIQNVMVAAGLQVKGDSVWTGCDGY